MGLLDARAQRSTLVTVAAVILLAGCGEGEPGDPVPTPVEQAANAVAEDYLTASTEGDKAACQELVMTGELCAGTVPEGPIELSEATDSEVSGSTAEITVETGGDLPPVVVSLTDEGGDWKVTGWESE